jgi:GMP synthase-like glutamine amidotransferase
VTKAVVLQHIRCEPPGIFEAVLDEHGVDVIRVELDEGDPLPDWRDAELVVAMGGPMSVNDESAHGWLAGEKHWIASAVSAGVPYFGVCLGAQLLAASLGASVRRGESPEVGVLPVTLTSNGLADPVFSVLGGEFAALQWHGDTFELPSGAVHLGRSAAYDNQAFRVRGAFAVQFHLEVTPAMFEEWSEVPAYVASLQAKFGVGGFEVLSEMFETSREEMARSARLLFERWLGLCQSETIQNRSC